MQSSPHSQRGITSIEAIIAFTALSLIITAIFIQGTSTETEHLRYKALLKNMKIVAHAAEEQKRNLGYYPRTVKALMKKSAYLQPEGNSGGVENEKLLKMPWNGPYVQNLKLRHDKVTLEDLVPDKTGEIVTHGREVYYQVGDFGDNEQPFVERLYRDCTYITDETALVKSTLVMPNYISVCGYEANTRNITRLSYYIGQK